MTVDARTEAAQKSRKAGRTVLFSLLGFFAVFASVDAFFVYTALKTNTGVVAENAYERGLHYNDLLDEARKRKNEQRPDTQN
jgi:nitrogen fixation protein FixH